METGPLPGRDEECPCRGGPLLKLFAAMGNRSLALDAGGHGRPELPEGWVWTRVGEVSRSIQYGTSDKATDDPSGIPVLRMGNIQDGKPDFTNLKYLPKDWAHRDEFILEGGDVLFSRTNSAELVGKTAVYKGGSPEAVFASYLIRVRVDSSACAPDFLALVINSSYGRGCIRSVVSQQVGQANVNGQSLQ
jgi:type I restriction enzyme S subunit